ncbi:unnamed protein product [Sphagnum jensenii]|uniref:Peroxidase n=1 Tax=Sphagnum jensenii TaxID=128206 RepID=A0ABP0VX22_9BRYO
MRRSKYSILLLLLLCAALAHKSIIQDVAAGGLVYNYYAKSCPRAERIIHDMVDKLYYKKGNTAVSFVRYVFHDCFNGCDASFLLDSTANSPAEKESHSQTGMRNFKWFDQIKAAVEKECPGVVSCADIIALAGSDSIAQLGGPRVPLKTGRRDSIVSLKKSADDGIPTPQTDVTSLLAYFKKIGLNTAQTVALLGVHTVGRAHCESFGERLYPKLDPIMDPLYGAMLRKRCPGPIPNPHVSVHFTYMRNDPGTPMLFDNHYYVNLINRQGLMHVDQELYNDARTREYVLLYAKDQNQWHADFTQAFQILSEYKPLTGSQGQIRKQCSYIN